MFKKIIGNGIVTFSLRNTNIWRSSSISTRFQQQFGNNLNHQLISNASIRNFMTNKSQKNGFYNSSFLKMDSQNVIELERKSEKIGKLEKRTFASSSSEQSSDIDPNLFHRVADETLERFQEKIESILADMNEIESDVTYQVFYFFFFFYSLFCLNYFLIFCYYFIVFLFFLFHSFMFVVFFFFDKPQKGWSINDKIGTKGNLCDK